MKKKYFFVTVALLLLLILLGYIIHINQKNSNEPLFSCVEGSPTGAVSCAFFNTRCSILKGGVVITDGHPGPYNFYNCYRKSSDAGKECASHEDCVYGCNLSVALNKCTLISNESLSSGDDGYNNGAEFFKKQYDCSTLKPGVCEELPQGGRNPGGILHSLEMEKQVLIETQTHGPIY